MNEVIEMVENSSRNFEWANKVRKTELPQRQAEIFYQTYLIQNAKEDTYKQTIEKLRKDNQ